jgi:hypothetical protein
MTSIYPERSRRSSFAAVPDGIQLEHPNIISMPDAGSARAKRQ